MITGSSRRFNSILSSYRFILHFDCNSLTGVDSVFPIGNNFIVRPLVNFDESAI